MLRDLIPSAAVVGFLVNPTNPTSESQIADVRAAVRSFGVDLLILSAGSERDIDAAFASFLQQRVNAIVIGADSHFFSRRDQLVGLAARHALPAILIYASKRPNSLSRQPAVQPPSDTQAKTLRPGGSLQTGTNTLRLVLQSGNITD